MAASWAKAGVLGVRTDCKSPMPAVTLMGDGLASGIFSSSPRFAPATNRAFIKEPSKSRASWQKNAHHPTARGMVARCHKLWASATRKIG